MAETENAIVDEDTMNSIIDTIAEESIRDSINNIVKPTVEELKASANNFLMQSDILKIEIQNVEAMLTEQQTIRHSMQKSEYSTLEKYTNNQIKIRNFLYGESLSKLRSLALDFQVQVNNFIGQKVEMVYVFVGDNDNEPVLYEIENENILKGDYSSNNKIIARYRATQDNFENDLKRIVFNDKEYDMAGVTSATNTYKEIIQRYRNHKRTNRVMWLNPSPPVKWHVAKIYQMGDINEAYANIILSHQESLFTKMSILDTNIEIFMVMFYTDIDNVSGLLQGDVEYNNIEYGIKSAGATMLQLNEVQNLARMITETANVTEDMIRQEKERLKNNGTTRNAIYKKSGRKLIELPLNELKVELKKTLGDSATVT